LVADGERVIIARHGQLVAELVPVHQKEGFPFGIARENQLVPPGDAWWQPLSEEEIENWVNGNENSD